MGCDDEILLSNLSEKLKEKISERGLTICEISRLAEVSPAFLYDILRGKSAHPSAIRLAKIAQALDCDMNEFF
jgi:transcriptional regulator with XRE-family HTH domain